MCVKRAHCGDSVPGVAVPSMQARCTPGGRWPTRSTSMCIAVRSTWQLCNSTRTTTHVIPPALVALFARPARVCQCTFRESSVTAVYCIAVPDAAAPLDLCLHRPPTPSNTRAQQVHQRTDRGLPCPNQGYCRSSSVVACSWSFCAVHIRHKQLRGTSLWVCSPNPSRWQHQKRLKLMQAPLRKSRSGVTAPDGASRCWPCSTRLVRVCVAMWSICIPPLVLLAVRNWPTFVMRLIVPALFVFLIWLINILVVAGLNIFNQVRCCRFMSTLMCQAHDTV